MIYYEDDKILIGSGIAGYGSRAQFEAFVLSNRVQLRTIATKHCVYVRISPTEFESIKTQNTNIFRDFLEEQGIKTKISAASIRNFLWHRIRFEEQKDEFLFNLKFGKYTPS